MVTQDAAVIMHTTGTRGGEGQYTGNWEERKAETPQTLTAVWIFG